jgi:hypothetical protein
MKLRYVPSARASNGGTAPRRRCWEAADACEALQIVQQHLRSAVRGDGQVVHNVADGGLACDDKQQVCVNQVTAAALLALMLAADSFGKRPLNL